MLGVTAADQTPARHSIRPHLTLLAGALAGGMLMTVWRGALPRAAESAPSPAFSLGVFGALCAFAIWTRRRLAAIGRRADNAVVYDHGVKRFGLALGGSGAVWSALQPVWPPVLNTWADASQLGFKLTFAFLVWIPVAMWGGYSWGGRWAPCFAFRRGRAGDGSVPRTVRTRTERDRPPRCGTARPSAGDSRRHWTRLLGDPVRRSR